MAPNKITTYSFRENFIPRLVDDLEENYLKKGVDLNRLAIVFGGRRPALFVKRELARRLKRNFFPPRFFTIDEFIACTVRKSEDFEGSRDLDQCYLLYNLAREQCPQLLKGRETFARFLPWTREILSFIDQLDLENVPDEKLSAIGANARIGYAVPDDINRLLENIIVLRRACHEHMSQKKIYSRGFQYLRAAQGIARADFGEFEKILFCNFFYLNRSEEAVIKNLYDRDMARMFFQGDDRRWPVLERAAGIFDQPVREGKSVVPASFQLKLYSAFDGHSQVGMAREILKTIPALDKTVIVLPNPDHIIPLLSEITSQVREFNISMGYPLQRSSLYSLLEFIFKAQLSRKDGMYYSRDYLRVLRHPLIKNLDTGRGGAVARVLIHKIEEMLNGMIPSTVTGHLFVALRDILDLDELYLLAQETLRRMGIIITLPELQAAMRDIHALVFEGWEGIENFSGFAGVLGRFFDAMLRQSSLSQYPLNLNIVDRIMDIKEEIASVSFCGERFSSEEIFKIFAAKIEREIVAFAGSPLKGLQILGLFETRSLNFDHVIVLDANEGVLPRLNVYEPLIPREVMISLNLDRLEEEEEIQRYQFMRLISSAKEVHLVFAENAEKEKSRFVEELLWEEEKKQGRLGAVASVFPCFHVKVATRAAGVAKTPEMIEFLRKCRFSASSVNTYLRDPLEFYYSYVLGLKEKEDLLNEPENREVGMFVHEFLEEVFKPMVGGKPVLDEKFQFYFQSVLEERFDQTFGKGKRADAFLLKTVLKARMARFLENETANPLRQIREILFVEKRFEDRIPLSCGEMNFVYRVDRVDRLIDGTVMILDYKTGSVDPMPKAIDRIEAMPLSRERIAEQVVSFQVPLYFYYLNKYFKNDPVNAAYYNLRTLEMNFFIDRKMTFERDRINSAFLRALDHVMAEILNPEIPFTPGQE